jgi:hypothetical protein
VKYKIRIASKVDLLK